jgi:DNA-binding CsgD family transcriptional regulator
MRVGGNVILAAAPFSRSSQSGVAPFVAVHVAAASGAPPPCDRLSPREQQVAGLLAEGYSNVNVSAVCGVTTNTARTLIRRIYRKLGVFNRADLVREMMRY